jgi:hypothetical protein
MDVCFSRPAWPGRENQAHGPLAHRRKSACVARRRCGVRAPGGPRLICAASISGDALNSYFRERGSSPWRRTHSRATLAHQEERPTRNGQVTRSTRVGGSQGSGTDPASDGGAKDNAWRSPSRPPIYVDVAQFGRARRRHRRGRRFDPGHPLQALVAQLADAHGLDPWLSSMRVRIPPSARNDLADAARARLDGHRTFNPDCRGSSPLGGTAMALRGAAARWGSSAVPVALIRPRSSVQIRPAPPISCRPTAGRRTVTPVIEVRVLSRERSTLPW